ncbi:MAG: class I SAM-dependent methyltransferase [Anaerolineae bacterium]
MMRLTRIPPAIMQETAADEQLTTSLPYRHSSWIVRELFWSRLQRLIALCPHDGRNSVLDLGGGSGVLLPTLSQMFRQVICLDRFVGEAQGIVAHYRLGNVTLIEGDLLNSGLADGMFDVIIAADVLEHILQLRQACQEIYRLAAGKFLITGPTENLLYRLGRLICGFEKPEDHYFTYRQVEEHILDSGFRLERRSFVPVNLGEPFSAFGVACFGKTILSVTR